MMENTNKDYTISKSEIKKGDNVIFCEYYENQFNKNKPMSQEIKKAILDARTKKVAVLEEELGFLENDDMSMIEKREEIALLIGCRKEEISFSEEEVIIKNGMIRFYCGDLDLSRLTSVEGLVLPLYISGNLNLSGLKSAEGLTFPLYVGGDLKLNSLKLSKELTLPLYVGYSLNLSGLKSAEGLTFPLHVGVSLCLNGLRSVERLTLPLYIGEELCLANLKSTEELIVPKSTNFLKTA